MTEEAPPAYDEAVPSYPSVDTQQPPPAYPELDHHPPTQDNDPAAAPPYSPVQPQVEPVVMYEAYSPPQGGETYESTTTNAAANNNGAGEAVNGKVVYVYPNGQNAYLANNVHNIQPSSNEPKELFHFKIRDHRINIFRPGNTTEGCVCCCHLQLAVYISLCLFLVYNALRVDGLATRGNWSYYHEDLAAYDTLLAVVYALHLPINILCFFGVWKCRANWIRPQVFAVASYAVISVLSIILDSVYGYGEFAVYFWIIVGIVIIAWWTWVFQRVYLWAYYYEHGGVYHHDMMRPPPKALQAAYRIQQVQNNGANQVEMQPPPR